MTSTFPRSLAFSESGRNNAERLARKRFGPNFKAELAKAIKARQNKDISKDTVRRAFDLENIRQDLFDAVCHELGLSPKDVSDPQSYNYGRTSGKTTAAIIPNAIPPKQLASIDELVAHVREAVQTRIHRDCSQINPLLGQGEIQKRYVEPEFLRLQQLPSEQLLDSEGLIGQVDEENYDRLGIHIPHDSRLGGSQAVIESARLLVYGGPGSGKTSYLKWIAIQCNQGSILSDHVPIFLQVRDFAAAGGYPSLQTYIEQYFEACNIQNSGDTVRLLLSNGRILLLLDGFDEMPEANQSNIAQRINTMLDQSPNCRFVFSCRPPLRLPFSNFRRVFIAAFSAKAVNAYVKKWFSQPNEEPSLAEQFLERLRHQRTLGELTRTPMLLELLCLVFKANQKFPRTRAGVYKKGIEELLSSRDQNFENDNFPRRINQTDIENLLRKIAADFFITPSPQILFSKRDVERKIEDHFSSLFRIDPISIPASAILRRLELRNGLLVSRSYNHCSFSHLTFQEYFTADHLASTGRYAIVYEHIIKQEWRFVIELIAELLPNTQIDSFLENFKQKLDSFINSNDKICRFFKWIDEMAAAISASIYTQQSHKQPLLRAWYFVFSFDDIGAVSNIGRVSQQFDFPDYDLATSTITSDVLESHQLFYRAYHATKTDNYSLFLGMVDAIYEKFKDDSPWFENQLKSWRDVIHIQQQNYQDKSHWWSQHRESWQERVGKFMGRYHNLKCDWGFTLEEQALLRKYYESTRLLSLCMNRSDASPEKRHNLAERMLCLDAIAPTNDNSDEFVGF